MVINTSPTELSELMDLIFEKLREKPKMKFCKQLIRRYCMVIKYTVTPDEVEYLIRLIMDLRSKQILVREVG